MNKYIQGSHLQKFETVDRIKSSLIYILGCDILFFDISKIQSRENISFNKTFENQVFERKQNWFLSFFIKFVPRDQKLVRDSGKIMISEFEITENFA